VHLFASHHRHRKEVHNSEASLPKSEGSKAMSYIGFTAILTAGALLLKAAVVETKIAFWPGRDSSFRAVDY